MRYLLSVIVLLFTLITPGLALAQFSGTVGATALTITINPPFPSPGDTVVASIDDYSLGVTGASIAWSINDLPLTEATNQRNLTLPAGEPGSQTTITAALTLPSGQTISASQTITPQYVDIIIEPQTYTPQFYRGRALPVHQSLVRATALLQDHTGLVDASRHTYTWTVNNTVVGGGGQRGAYQTLYTVPHGSSHTLTLEVHGPSGELVTRRTTAVQSADVDVQLYEVSALYGLSHRIVTAPLSMIGNSLTLLAAPYNLDLRAMNNPNSLFTEWQINQRRTPTASSNPFEITLNREGFGTAAITFKVRNLEALLQGDETRTTIQF